MTLLPRWKPLAVLAAATLWAQTPAPGPNPAGIDTEQARVILATEQPHRPGTLHEHATNRVQIYLDNGITTLTSPTGKVERIVYKAGDVRWSVAGGKHVSENITDHPVRIVEIELKSQPHPGLKSSALDPLKVDPKHYKLELENDQVRVVRVRFGPHEKGVRHEHSLNHIVVYLNDQPKGKAGEFRLAPPETHTEENPLDQAVERIAIDLK